MVQKRETELPWREDATPYHIWVSEIMLQQTRVEAVKRYYARFLEKLPTIEALAECEEEILLKLWEGLGYYNRVKNMQKAAKVIVEKYDGEMPSDYDKFWSCLELEVIRQEQLRRLHLESESLPRWKCAKGSGKAGRVGKRYCKDVNEKRS